MSGEAFYNPDDVAVFRVSPLRQRLFFAPWILIAGPLLIGSIVTGNQAMTFIALLLTVVWAPLIWIVCVYTRLSLSPEGVEVRQVGYRLKSSWYNIAEFERTRGAEGFILYEPMNSKGAELLADASELQICAAGAPMPAYQGGRGDLVEQLRFIPIEPFAYWLKKGTLSDEIRRYAPHLLEIQPVPEPASQPAIPVPLYKKLLVAGLISCLVTLGLLIGADVLSPQIVDFINTLFGVLLVISLSVYSLANFYSAFSRLRRGRYFMGSLLLMMAVIGVCGVILALSSLTVNG